MSLTNKHEIWGTAFSGHLFTAHQRSWGKVMFSLMCVCLSTGVWDRGTHVTITYDTLDLTALDPVAQLPPLWTLGLTASDIWWPSLETCSNLFTWGPPCSIDIWCLLASGRYSSYWNAVLFLVYFYRTIRVQPCFFLNSLLAG